MQTDAVEITYEAVVLDDGAGRALLDEHSSVQRLEVNAGAANNETTDHRAWRGDDNYASRAGPNQAGAGLSFHGHGLRQSKDTAVLSFDENRVAGNRPINDSLQVAARWHDQPLCRGGIRKRNGNKRDPDVRPHGYTFRGSTIMRPCISMCMA